jgi:transglutaminase superfamily protein
MSRLAQFAGLSRQDRELFTAALIALPVCVLGLRLAGYRRLRSILSSFVPAAPEPTLRLAHQQTELLARTAWAVRAAAAHGLVRGRCLPQSLALWWLLRRRQVASEIRFGARRRERELEAHAWVEVDGVAIPVGREADGAFAPFPSAPTAGEARRR